MLTYTSAETSNLRLEDIDLIFKDGRNPVVVAREMAQGQRSGVLDHSYEDPLAEDKIHVEGIEESRP